MNRSFLTPRDLIFWPFQFREWRKSLHSGSGTSSKKKQKTHYVQEIKVKVFLLEETKKGKEEEGTRYKVDKKRERGGQGQ